MVCVAGAAKWASACRAWVGGRLSGLIPGPVEQAHASSLPSPSPGLIFLSTHLGQPGEPVEG